MSNFVLTKQREVLTFCFNWKKSAAEAHPSRMLVEVYGGILLQLINHVGNDFDVSRMEISALKPRSGQPKKFEDKELEALLEEDQSQTQEEFAKSLGIIQ